MREKALVLLVEPTWEDCRSLGEWLETAGYGVMECPGPMRQDFTCLGVRGIRCGLVEIADLAILDGRLLDPTIDPAATTRLLRHYIGSGKPVLVLADGNGAGFSFEDERVAFANRANRRSVLAAVSSLMELRPVHRAVA